MTPFCAACFMGRTEIVKLLLEDPRIDINVPDHDRVCLILLFLFNFILIFFRKLL